MQCASEGDVWRVMNMENNTCEKSIHLCYCGNKKVFPQILLSLLSAVKHTDSALTVRIFTMDLTDVDERFTPITEGQRYILQSVICEKNAQSKVLLVDVGKEYRKYLMGGRNEGGFYTPYALLRLLFDKVELPDKLIYLDTDTMFCGDVAELWSYDVGDCEFGAVKDKEGSFWINRRYCNSGVLLLNMKRCRETDLFAGVRRMVMSRRMIMPDQSALNKLAKKKCFLPRRFNEQRGIRPDTVIKHFCRGFRWFGPFFIIYNYKQTDRKNVHEKLKIFCFDDIYEKYDRLSEQYDFGL